MSHTDVGVAAGLLNAAFQIGSGLGIAVVTAVATTTMKALSSSHGADLRQSLSSGHANALAAAVAFPVRGLLVVILMLRSKDGRSVVIRAGEAKAKASAQNNHDGR